jgi:predicted butyrate kinase (DUF1464 family)
LYLSENEASKPMSIQEMKSKLHRLVDAVDDESTLEGAGLVLSGQMATLAQLTAEQRDKLNQAIREHDEGKTVSHEEMKQRHRAWLTK